MIWLLSSTGPITIKYFPVYNYEKEVEEMTHMTRLEFMASFRRWAWQIELLQFLITMVKLILSSLSSVIFRWHYNTSLTILSCEQFRCNTINHADFREIISFAVGRLRG